jgi:hypothetical protein
MLRLILRTVGAVFPYVTIWHFENDIALVARTRAAPRDLASMHARFEAGRDYLARFGVYDLPSLLSLQLASEEGFRALLDAGPLHDDDRPTLEYRAPRAQFARAYSFFLTTVDERRQLDARSRLLFGELLRQRPLRDGEMVDFTLLQAGQPWAPEPFRFRYFEQVLASCREPWTLGQLVVNLERTRRPVEAERALAAVATLDPDGPRTWFLRAELRLRRVGEAAAPGDRALREALLACDRAPDGDPFRRACRGLAERLAVTLPD